MNQITIASIILAGGLVVSALVATNGLQGNSGVKTFNIVMENNQYRPAEITANVGDQVVINFENRDAVSHAVALPEFNAAVPNGHVPAGGRATMQFIASRAVSTDAAVCGCADPTDKTDDHGEELIVTII